MPATTLSIPCGAITLEGALHRPEAAGPVPAVVVCHPHPQYGGDMHNNVVSAIVDGLRGHGIAALRFNFRGVGGSGGEHGGEQEDVRAALAHAASLPELDPARLGLAGYSFGAGMAAAVVDGSVAALALVAMPAGMGADRASLVAYANATLLMVGDQDQFCPTDAVGELAATLGDSVRTRIVEGADHFWSGREIEVRGTVGEFFAAHL